MNKPQPSHESKPNCLGAFPSLQLPCNKHSPLRSLATPDTFWFGGTQARTTDIVLLLLAVQGPSQRAAFVVCSFDACPAWCYRGCWCLLLNAEACAPRCTSLALQQQTLWWLVTCFCRNSVVRVHLVLLRQLLSSCFPWWFCLLHVLYYQQDALGFPTTTTLLDSNQRPCGTTLSAFVKFF